MTINKNFVVSNGLEVSNDLIYANSDTRRVGINSAIPDFELDVNGDVSFTGALSVGGTTGTVGAYLESTGDGLQWTTLPTLRVVERYTATEGQTIFPSVGFFPFQSAEFIDVFVDGVKLAQDEYNTLVGNNRIELLAAAIEGETIELVAYNASTVAAGYTGIQGLTVAEEGVVVGLSDGVKLINFVGAYVTAIGSGAGVTIFLDDRLAQDTNYWLSNASGLSTTTSVGVNSANPSRTLDVVGTARVSGILEAGTFYSNTGIVTTLSGTSFNYTGVNTATTLFSTTANLNRGNVVTGVVTTLSGTSFNYTGVNTATTLFSTTANATTGNIVTGVVTTLSGTSFNYTGVNTATTLFSTTANLNRGNVVTGVVTTLSGTSFNYTGVNTATTLFSTTANATTGNIVTGIVTNLSGTNASYSGIGTFGSLNIGATQIVSSGRQLQNIASLDATTTATIESAVANSPNTFTDLNVSGIGTIATLGATTGTVTTLNGTTLNYATGNIVTGIVTTVSGTNLNYSGIGTVTTLNVGTGGTVVTTTSAGNVGIGSTIPASRLTVRGGDISVGISTAHGVILTSPNGTQYRLIVADNGTLSTVAV